jgi:hypothetical protein
MEDIIAIIGELAKVPATWKTGGAAVGALAIVYVLIRATKIGFLSRLLDKWFGSAKWARPTLSAVVGFLVGSLTALSQHKPWMQIIFGGVAGAVSGLGATGLDQWLTSMSPGRREEALTSAAALEVIVREDVKIETEVEASEASKALATASMIEDPKARRSALASWGRKHLPPAVPRPKPAGGTT